MQIYLVDFCSLEELMENNTGSEWTQAMQSHRLRFLVVICSLRCQPGSSPMLCILAKWQGCPSVPVFQQPFLFWLFWLYKLMLYNFFLYKISRFFETHTILTLYSLPPRNFTSGNILLWKEVWKLQTPPEVIRCEEHIFQMYLCNDTFLVQCNIYK